MMDIYSFLRCYTEGRVNFSISTIDEDNTDTIHKYSLETKEIEVVITHYIEYGIFIVFNNTLRKYTQYRVLEGNLIIISQGDYLYAQ